MIDPSSLNDYSKKYKIDQYTVLREYIQVVFLNSLYKIADADSVIFKGGTSLRLIYNSPRFSEDLDFNSNLDEKDISKLIRDAVKETSLSVPGILVKDVDTIQGYSAKLYFDTGISPMPLTVKLDFSMREKIVNVVNRTVATELPVQSFSLIEVSSQEEILAEKLRTIFQRVKGRDIYDIWYLLNRRVPIDEKLVNIKMKMINKSLNIEEVKERIGSFNKNKLKQDLFKFLPIDQRDIVSKLPELIIDQLKVYNRSEYL